jgi:TonB family protein
MKTSIVFFMILLPSALYPQGLPDPILVSGQMPMYPPLARAAHLEGEIKLSFMLDRQGNVASVDFVSGDPSFREASALIVKSWRFELPKNLFRTEWRYETAFQYHLSGRELEPWDTAKLTVIFDSFHRIEIMSDSFKPVMQKGTAIQVPLMRLK